jgi:hypothetical protein
MISLNAGKAISKALVPLVGGAAKELSSYFGDEIRFFHWKNAVRILERAQQFCKKKNLHPKSVPIKFIVPFLESASLEEDATSGILSDMWASLFASAVSSYQARHAVYVDVLKKLSSKDARFIRSLNRKMRAGRTYWEERFDADLCNVNDKQETAELFDESFQNIGKKFLVEHTKDRFFGGFEKDLKNCTGWGWRVDIIPLIYDVSFYNRDGLDSATSGPFSKKKIGDTASNLVALNLMERFDVVSWVPAKPKGGKKAVRATCSYIMLTSLGFDFIDACLKDENVADR